MAKEATRDCGPTFNGQRDECHVADGAVAHCYMHGAARDLYEALIALTDPEGHIPHSPHAPRVCTGECKAARAAIAKAEGR